MAAAYGVPLVAYGDALAGGSCDGAAWTAAPGQRNPAHPLASTHALVAEALAVWFGALGARVSVGRSDALLEPVEMETETGTLLWAQPPLSAGLAALSLIPNPNPSPSPSPSPNPNPNPNPNPRRGRERIRPV